MRVLTPPARWALGAAGAAAGLGAAAALVWGGYRTPPDLLGPTLALNLAVGWSFVGGGIASWRRRPDSRTGLLMVVLGLAWFARFAVAVATPAAFVLGVAVGSVYLSVLVHLLATFPSGRLTTWPQRAVTALAYVLSAPLDLVFLALGAKRGLGDGLPPNGLVTVMDASLFTYRPDPVDLAVQSVVLLLCAALLVIVVRRWSRAGAAERRALGPGVWGGVVIIVTIFVQRTAFLLLLPPQARVVVTWAAQVVLVVWPLALLLGVLRSRLDRSAVGTMLTELDGSLPPERMQDVLARTLHDPTLRLAYRMPGGIAFVDAHGEPVEVAAAPGRALTYVERGGVRIAVLVHDAALAREPELVRAVAAGAGMALQNERLQAEVRAQLREVRASRARIVEAADAARRRVERDLHDGAQQRLVTVALGLKLARAQLGSACPPDVAALLDETNQELGGALTELRELARGIYPVLLTDAGLGPALRGLAERAAVATTVRTAPEGRLPEPVERTAYFVVSEALANAAKHADASEVVVAVEVRGGVLVLEVTDDGVGGADPAGSGLRGLADRVAAVGGRLAVDSPAGAGTRLRAELPC